MYRPMRWWLRGSLGLLVFPLPLIPQRWLKPGNYVTHGVLVAAEAVGFLPPTPAASMGSPVRGWRSFPSPPPWLMRVALAITVVAILLPSLWFSLFVYHRLTFCGLPPDRFTRCGRCGQVLRGLAKPECPRCEQPI
jgi:hypothetical protein